MRLLASTALLSVPVLMAGPVWAANINVANESQLAAAISSAGNGDTITFTSNITLSGNLPPVMTSVTFIGNNNTLDGNSVARGLFVYSGAVAIQNLTISAGAAVGGTGGEGNSGAGGGLGAGGALFIGSAAQVTLSSVQLNNNTALGGAGGTSNVANAAGGGGGLGGNGGSRAGGNGGSGGGGLYGAGGGGGPAGGAGGGGVTGAGAVGLTGGGGGGATGAGSAAAVANGGSGGAGGGGGGGGSAALGPGTGGAGTGGGGAGGNGDTTSGNGGNGGAGAANGGGGGGGAADPSGTTQIGGNGGAGGLFGGGGGSGTNSSSSATNAGNGGAFGGGGGGGTYSNGGAGGFGGGGGGGGFLANGGVGGYGGGGGGNGGSSGGSAAAGGFAAGSGASGRGSGGGGGALGGAVFVQGGGSLTLAGPVSVNGSSVTAGAAGAPGSGGNSGTNGAAFGAGFFLAGSGTVAFQPGVGETQTIGNAIADEAGAVASGYVAPAGFGTPGAWGLSKSGAGTLTLSANNLYSGGTTLNAGTLAISTDANLGAAVGGLTFNGGTLRTTAAITSARSINVTGWGNTVDTGVNTLTLTGPISGAGALIKSGTGTLVLSGVNTSFGTVIGEGTVDVRNSAALGSALYIYPVGPAFGPGPTLLAGANNLNLTLPSGLFVGSGATIDTQANTMTVSGRVVDGLVVGAGPLIKAGTGTLRLEAANTYTIGTRLYAGTIEVANNAALGTSGLVMETSTILRAGANGLAIANTIWLNGVGDHTVSTQANAMTLGGVIFGVGAALTKTGAGALNLTGVNSYSGATNVNAGTLSVNGSIASSSMTTVNTGAALGGNGTVGNTTIDGGALAPGNSIGTLTVQGNLVFTAASSYMVEVDPSSSDRTNVTGTATLGGATVRATFANGSYVAKQYTIINAAGGVNGTFASLVNTNLPANFNAALSYDANNAFLNLALNFTPPSTPTFGNGLTGNQSNVANALVNSFNAAGGIPLAYGALTPQGLTQAAGEAATGTQQATFNVMSQFLNAMLDSSATGRGGNVGQGGVSSYADEALSYASTRKGRNANEREAYAAMVTKAPPRVADAFNRWSVWAAGYGGTQTTTGNATVGSADTTARIYGTAAGADYRFSPDTLVGFALGGAGTSYNLTNGLGKGSSDVFQAGIYGRHQFGGAYVAAALAYGWQDVTTDRTVLGVDRLRARFDANALSGRLEGGYRFAALGMGVTPYAAGQFTTFFLPGYTEQVVAGGNMFALAYTSKDVTASRSELGVRTDKSFALNDAQLTLRGRAAWAHNFNTDRSVQAAFQALPASGFIVNGAAQARDAALVSAGAEMAWRNGFSLSASFEGEFSRNVESYAGKGTVRYRW